MTRNEVVQCATCEGTGYVELEETVEEFCEKCNGEGLDNENCSGYLCSGEGVVRLTHQKTGESITCTACDGEGYVLHTEKEDMYGNITEFQSTPYQKTSIGCLPFLSILLLFISYIVFSYSGIG